MLLSILLTLATATTDPSPAAAALARIARLAGEWKGTMEWHGGRTGSGPIAATYTVSSYGSAVVEMLKDGATPTMTTVYHLDNGDLRMTHFCAAGNQPRLKADRIDLEAGLLDFDYVDATNLKSPKAPHVDGFSMRFAGDDHLVIEFRFIANDVRSVETIDLRRQ